MVVNVHIKFCPLQPNHGLGFLVCFDMFLLVGSWLFKCSELALYLL